MERAKSLAFEGKTPKQMQCCLVMQDCRKTLRKHGELRNSHIKELIIKLWIYQKTTVFLVFLGPYLRWGVWGATKDACKRKGQGARFLKRAPKDTSLTSYPWSDLREDHWGCIFAILGFTKGTNSGSLTISGRGGQEHIMQQYKEWEYFSFVVELWANFPINVYKIKNFIRHKLRSLFT